MSDPQTLEELCDYIDKYAATIFVREKNRNGKWAAMSLAKLDGQTAIHHAMRFVKEGIIPVRILSDEEVDANRKAAEANHA